MILAQVPNATWPEMGGWMVGLIGVLGVVFLALGVVKSCIDLFGRKQSVETLITQSEQMLRIEIQAMNLRITQQRTDMEERFASLNIERTRNLEALHEKINGVRGSVDFIRGKMEGKRHD